MKVFIDTNVAVDFCAIREPFFKEAAIIIDMARKGMIEIVISSLTFVNIAYIMRKKFPKEDVVRKLDTLINICEVSPINGNVIRNAIASDALDFEDAVQFFSVRDANIDVVVTRDKKGFSKFNLVINTPQEFLEHCMV